MKKGNSRKLLIMLMIVSLMPTTIDLFARGHGGGHGGGGRGRGGYGRGGYGRGRGWGGRGYGYRGYGWGGHRGWGWGGYYRSRFGINLWAGGPAWYGWNGPYWGDNAAWLSYNSGWISPENDGPEIYNSTGQRIKFYVSDRRGSQYTLNVVTEDEQLGTFKRLDMSDMGHVDVFMNNNALAVRPRYGG